MKKKYKIFLILNFSLFLVVKFSVHLNMLVFVMWEQGAGHFFFFFFLVWGICTVMFVWLPTWCNRRLCSVIVAFRVKILIIFIHKNILGHSRK